MKAAIDNDCVQVVYRNVDEHIDTVQRSLAFSWRLNGYRVLVSIRYAPDFEDVEWKDFTDPDEPPEKVRFGW